MHDSVRSLIELLQSDKRYKYEAYVFVFEALRYAQTVLGLGTPAESEPADEIEEPPKTEEPGADRHVSGQELCMAIRQFAVEQYGLMAKTVLNSWGVNATVDFGEIVFNLIRIGKMRKTRQDRLEDFNDVYNFDTALRPEFKVTMPQK